MGLCALKNSFYCALTNYYIAFHALLSLCKLDQCSSIQACQTRSYSLRLDVNSADYDLRTPLHLASAQGQFDTVWTPSFLQINKVAVIFICASMFT